MMSLAHTVSGVGIMAYPIVAQFLMESYGFRGAIAIVAAINSNAILGMLVMHPVEWHYKTVEIPFEETNSCS